MMMIIFFHGIMYGTWFCPNWLL